MTSRKDDGGPASPTFPVEHDRYWDPGQPGKSLRDWFAGMVLQGMYAKHAGENYSWMELASEAYGQADAMLKARQQ